MIPFVPTLERIHCAIRDLRFENKSEEGYSVVVGYDLFADMVTDAQMWGWIVPERPGKYSVFGLPLEVDHSVPRGWIRLRHEVTR